MTNYRAKHFASNAIALLCRDETASVGRRLAVAMDFCILVAAARAQTLARRRWRRTWSRSNRSARTRPTRPWTNFLSTRSRTPPAATRGRGGAALPAGGRRPCPAPTPRCRRITSYETPEREGDRGWRRTRRISVAFGGMVQLHCGLMRLAALFVEKPDAPTLQDRLDRLAEDAAAQAYPQLTGERHVRNLTMKDSPISSYLNFNGWGDKEQGQVERP